MIIFDGFCKFFWISQYALSELHKWLEVVISVNKDSAVCAGQFH